MPYTREQAVYPDKSLRHSKFWPASGRLDEVYGDTNVRGLTGPLDETMLNPCSSSYANVALSTSTPRHDLRSASRLASKIDGLSTHLAALLPSSALLHLQ